MYIKELTREQIELVFNKYMTEDFPEDELKPLKRILEMLDEGIYFAAGLYEDNDALAGYAYFVKDDENKTALLDYFAILKENRCKGYGSVFFDNVKPFLKKHDVDNLYLETENVDFAKDEADKQIRIRRIAFYEKNMLIMSQVRSQLFGVDYRIMNLNVTGNNVTKGLEFDNQVRYHLSKIYDVMFDRKKLGDRVKIYE